MFPFRTHTGVRLILAFSVILLLFAVVSGLTLRAFQRIDEATDRVQTLQVPLEAGLKMLSSAYKLFEAQTTLVMTENFEAVHRFRETMALIKDTYQKSIRAHLRTKEEHLWLDALAAAFNDFEDLFLARLVPAALDGDLDRVQAAHRASEKLLETIDELNTRLSRNFQLLIYDATRTALRTTHEVRVQTAWFMVAAVALAITTSWTLGLSIVIPIRQLIKGTQRVSEGQLDNPVRIRRSDEFGLLADSFNDMTRRLLEHQGQLVQASKLATIGRIASGVAHEINNPIGVILGYTKVMAASIHDPDALADLRTIEEEALQCKRIVEGLLTIAKPVETGGYVPDVGAVLRDVLGRIGKQREMSGLSTMLDLGDEPVPVDIDEMRLRQIAMNFAQNAFDAMADGGTLSVGCSTADADGQKQVVIQFEDTGQGIAADDMGKVFEPFFTTKARGTGLGLAICHGIVSAYGGRIDVHSEVGKGTRFTVRLPQHAATSGALPNL